jgi:hypothetical protein
VRFTIATISILLSMLSLACSFAYGQSDHLITQRIADLKSGGIDTIITYYQFPGNKSYVFRKGYITESSKYIIWKDEAAYYIQKASSCYDSLGQSSFDTLFKMVAMNNIQAYTYLTANIDSIGKQELKAGMIKDVFDGKDSLFEIHYSHDDLALIELYVGKLKYTKTIRWSQLDDGIISNADGSVRFRWESVNYNYNINTALYQLYALLLAAINELEARNAFNE